MSAVTRLLLRHRATGAVYHLGDNTPLGHALTELGITLRDVDVYTPDDWAYLKESPHGQPRHHDR